MILNKNLTLKEKIAQMIIAGISGATVDDEARELVTETKVGGIILYSRNTPTADVTFDLNYHLNELVKEVSLPLIIAIDEEHGRVNRIKEGTTHFIDMASVGAMGDLSIPKEIAQITSRELLACGINMNLAPVCDVNVTEENGVIGDRSFSSDPETVAKMAAAYIKEGISAGMMLCAKHFPGHGNTKVDSHYDLPVVDKTLDELETLELVPFEAAIRERVPAIMTAHIVFPKIDDLPATMSREIITGILIKKLWYTGVIISDDMSMGAITKNYGTVEAFSKSINAGVNMFIVSNMLKDKIDVRTLIDDLEAAAEKGDIDINMIDESVEKIMGMKKKYIQDTLRENTLRKKSLRQDSSLKFAKYLEERKRRLSE